MPLNELSGSPLIFSVLLVRWTNFGHLLQILISSTTNNFRRVELRPSLSFEKIKEFVLGAPAGLWSTPHLSTRVIPKQKASMCTGIPDHLGRRFWFTLGRRIQILPRHLRQRVTRGRTIQILQSMQRWSLEPDVVRAQRLLHEIIADF
jgi:hypothetical protein